MALKAGFTLKLILLALVLLLPPAGTAFAADINVDATCTLAQAINEANEDTTDVGSCEAGDAGADTITLTANVDLAASLPAITEDLTINGNGHTISGAVSGTATYQCFNIVTAGVELYLNGLIIDGCKSTSAAPQGGAIRYRKDDESQNQPRSSLTLTDVVVRNSRGSGPGGGIYTRSAASAFPIYVTISRSAIHGNTASLNDGGGISFQSGTIATINNSTIYGNTAGGAGGGIYATATQPGSSQFTFNHVTITGNTANINAVPDKGGGIRIAGGTLTLRNSIIAGNTNNDDNEDCRIAGTSAVTIAAMSNNIIGTGATANCPTISVGGSPITDPGLAANPTVLESVPPYYDLMASSPAINAAGDCTRITTEDQRGQARPYPSGGACDIGAIEYLPPADIGPIIYVPRDCALRHAISAANTNRNAGRCQVGDAGADTIILTDNVDLVANLPDIAESLTINGEGHSISGEDMYSCFDVVQDNVPTTGLSLTLNRVIIKDCKHTGAGGAIRFWNQRDQNDAQGRSSLTLNDVVVRGSEATGHGGGILTRSVHLTRPIYVEINRSAIHDNRSDQNGGGIYFAEGTKATVNNSTIYMNTAANRGGGIYGQADTPAEASFTLNHVTITRNTASLSTSPIRAGGVRFDGGTLTIRNSIIAGNSNDGDNENCQLESAAAMITVNVSKSIIGSGATANCPTISVGGSPVTDPELAASPTVMGLRAYYDLMASSPAIDAAPDCAEQTMDQRRYLRPWPLGGACDIGAIEYGSQLPAPPTPAPIPIEPTPIPTEPPPPSTAILATCPAPPGSGRFGLIGSASWRGHYARLGIQARNPQWAAGAASVRGVNICFWDYDCSTDGHWAYGAYHATRGHTYLAPGTPPPAAVGRSGGKFNLCYSAWENGCNSTEAWDFGHASGKQIYEEYLHQRVTAAGGC